MESEWRELKEFPNYEINRQGTVRDKETGLTLATWNFDRIPHYQFFKDGRSHFRHADGLVSNTF